MSFWKHALLTEPVYLIKDRISPGTGGETEFVSSPDRTNLTITAENINRIRGKHSLPTEQLIIDARKYASSTGYSSRYPVGWWGVADIFCQFIHQFRYVYLPTGKDVVSTCLALFSCKDKSVSHIPYINKVIGSGHIGPEMTAGKIDYELTDVGGIPIIGADYTSRAQDHSIEALTCFFHEE